MSVDLLLSAGWLAFGRHIGFLHAVEELGLEVDAVVGTSSGSLVGAMWAAGVPLDDIEAEVRAMRPMLSLRPSRRPWTGLCSMRGVVARLNKHLPERIEDLPRPFAVGVATTRKKGALLTSGPLAPAVAASCAVPGLFAPVSVNGTRWLDGGWVSRAASDAYRAWRPGRQGIVHMIRPSTGPAEDVGDLPMVTSEPSGAHLWSLGDVSGQREATRQLTRDALSSLNLGVG